MAEGDVYGFPILNTEECIAFFKEVSVTSICEEDFKKPEARRWQTFYMQLLEIMMGQEVDLAAAQNRLQALSGCEYGELHEESFTLMSFALMMQRAMRAAGIADFTVRDLIEPRPRRLLRIVSAAINFIRFSVLQKDVFYKKKDDMEKKRESYESVLKENADLKKMLHEKQKVHDSHMMKMTKLQDENDAIALRMQELHKQRESLQRKLAEMKVELTQTFASIDQVKVNILTVKAEAEKLSQRVIQSPERLKAEQERGKNRIMDLKATVEDKLGRLAELQNQKDKMQNQQKYAEQAVRLLRDISNDAQREREMQKELQHRQDNHQDLHSTLLELSSKVQSLQQVLASRNEKRVKMDLLYQSKKASLEEQLSQLSQLKETLRDPKRSSECRKLIQEKERIKDEMNRNMKEHEAMMERANKLYSEMMLLVDKSNIEVGQSVFALKTVK